MIKKSVLLLIFVSLISLIINVSSVFAENAELKDFEDYDYKRTLKVKYTGDDKKISKDTVIGYTHVFIDKYKYPERIDGKNYNSILVKLNMEPTKFKNKKNKNYYGFSQYLNLSSKLPEECVFQDNNPKNAFLDVFEYNWNLRDRIVGSGLSYSSDFCNICDDSNFSEFLYKSSFDYISNRLDFNNKSKRNMILFNSSYQYGSFDWTAFKERYSMNLSVCARYGVANEKNSRAKLKFTSENSQTYKINYS